MRLIVLLVCCFTLVGCVTEVTTHYVPPPGYRTSSQLYAAVPDVLYLPRNQISRGPESWVATGHIYGGHNWERGFCLEQWRNGVLTYMCTTRWFLDPQPFGVPIKTRRMPSGFCGLEAPVYFAGPAQCGQRSGGVVHYQYQGRPQYNGGYRHRHY